MAQNVEFQLLRDLRHHINLNMKRHYVSNISMKFHVIWRSRRPAMMKYVIVPVGRKFGWTAPQQLKSYLQVYSNNSYCLQNGVQFCGLIIVINVYEREQWTNNS